MLDFDALMTKFGLLLVTLWMIIGTYLAFDEVATRQTLIFSVKSLGLTLPLIPTIAIAFILVALVGGIIIQGLNLLTD